MWWQQSPVTVPRPEEYTEEEWNLLLEDRRENGIYKVMIFAQGIFSLSEGMQINGALRQALYTPAGSVITAEFRGGDYGVTKVNSLSDLTVAQLKELLQVRGLSQAGLKAELVTRLEESG